MFSDFLYHLPARRWCGGGEEAGLAARNLSLRLASRMDHPCPPVTGHCFLRLGAPCWQMRMILPRLSTWSGISMRSRTWRCCLTYEEITQVSDHPLHFVRTMMVLPLPGMLGPCTCMRRIGSDSSEKQNSSPILLMWRLEPRSRCVWFKQAEGSNQKWWET